MNCTFRVLKRKESLNVINWWKLDLTTTFICFLQVCRFLLQDIKWLAAVVFWIIVCLYLLFGLSSWRHPFTAEDPLVSKWYKAKFLQICSDEEKKTSSTSWMAWERVHFQLIFIFRVNYSLNAAKCGPLKHIRPYYLFSNNLIIMSRQGENNTDKELK